MRYRAGPERPSLVVPTHLPTFPPSFDFGTATSAHQVDGAGAPSNWSEWEARVPSPIARGERVGRATEHSARFAGDVERMEALGATAYRFSLDWAALEPAPGRYDERGFAEVAERIALLRARAIEPMLTLHHFTHPLWLERAGGFTTRFGVDALVRFADEAFRRLPTVRRWCTVNEPSIYAVMGHLLGRFPPGRRSVAEAVRVLHHLSLAHVECYRHLKSLTGGPEAEIGLAHHVMQFDPARPRSPLDRLLCHHADRLVSGAVLELLATGRFFVGQRGVRSFERRHPHAVGAADFLGLNYYSHLVLGLRASPLRPLCFGLRPGEVPADLPYAVYPEGLLRALESVRGFGFPIVVTEHGIADAQDDRRAGFFHAGLWALRTALDRGIDVRGYYAWSLLDNFEWSEGFAPRFGLYAVDYGTMARKLRAGARPLVEVMRATAQARRARSTFQ